MRRILLCLLVALAFVVPGRALAEPKHDPPAHADAKEKHADDRHAEPKVAEPREPAARGKEKDPEGDDDADAPETEPEHHPTTVKLGVKLLTLSKFEIGPGTYNAEIHVTLHCDKEPCKPHLELSNGKITGRENLLDLKLHKEFKLKADVAGYVDLSEFPFDRHDLSIEMVERKAPFDYVLVLDEEETAIDANVKLPGWDIDGWSASVETQEPEKGMFVSELHYNLEITRPKMAAFFKTLLPAFFMAFVMGFTLLLKPKSAAGRLTAATGALMTVVMFHLSSTASLPPLGYLTRMDKFMLANYAVYFVNIVFAVAIVRLDEQKREKAAMYAYLIAGGMVPGLALCAWTLVFLRLV